MVRGTESKEKIFAKLMEVYPNAFFEDEGKILRVPMDESGSRVEIKVTLTAAKTNLKSDSATSAFPQENLEQSDFMPQPAQPSSSSIEISQEEKNNVAKLIKSLNL